MPGVRARGSARRRAGCQSVRHPRRENLRPLPWRGVTTHLRQYLRELPQSRVRARARVQRSRYPVDQTGAPRAAPSPVSRGRCATGAAGRVVGEHGRASRRDPPRCGEACHVRLHRLCAGLRVSSNETVLNRAGACVALFIISYVGAWYHAPIVMVTSAAIATCILFVMWGDPYDL